MTSFADMMTLLMAFFVLLFAMSTIDEQKFVALLKGLEENFGNSTLQDGLLDGGESILGANLEAGSAIPIPGGSLSIMPTPSIEPEDEADEAQVKPEPGKDVEQDPDPGEHPEDGGGYLTRKELEEVEEAIKRALNEQGLADDVNFRFNERGLVISIATDEILFAAGKADLKQGSLEILAIISEKLLEFDNTIWVDGHTDSKPFPTPEFYDNKRLSSDRANAVVSHMTYQLGMPSARLLPVGFGPDRPLAPNDTAENRAINRRVEIVISAGNGGTADADADADADVSSGDGDTEAQSDSPDVDGIEDAILDGPNGSPGF